MSSGIDALSVESDGHSHVMEKEKKIVASTLSHETSICGIKILYAVMDDFRDLDKTNISF